MEMKYFVDSNLATLLIKPHLYPLLLKGGSQPSKLKNYLSNSLKKVDLKSQDGGEVKQASQTKKLGEDGLQGDLLKLGANIIIECMACKDITLIAVEDTFLKC
jgi:hypothetical protein